MLAVAASEVPEASLLSLFHLYAHVTFFMEGGRVGNGEEDPRTLPIVQGRIPVSLGPLLPSSALEHCSPADCHQLALASRGQRSHTQRQLQHSW